MNNSKTLIGLIVAGLFIVAIIGWFTPVLPKANSVEGLSTGSMAAEDYNPYIMYNGGYYSAKPIETTSTLTAAGAVSFASTLGVSATSTMVDAIHTTAATTTVKILSSSSTQGGCLEMNATSTATKVRLMLSTLGATSTFSGTAFWSYGSCE